MSDNYTFYDEATLRKIRKMGNDKKETTESDIRLGRKYRDTVTGISGTATSTHKYLHGCLRVTLTFEAGGKVEEETFDWMALEPYVDLEMDPDPS